jgi:hypothetical protein
MTCAAAIAGCGSSAPVYVNLQNAIKSTETSKDHRAVSSVACTPPVSNVDRGDIVNLVCLVRFTDGTSYQANARVTHPIPYNGGSGYYHYTWDSPPPTDVTKTPLPLPTVTVPAASPGSLFYARNLRPIVAVLRDRFAGQLILQMALYPGELDAVLGRSGNAELVRARGPDSVTTVQQSSFEGSRSGITLSQFDPSVPERLAHEIATHADESISRLDRFVLASLPGDLAGWLIYPVSGPEHFQSLLQGDSLKEISPGGRHNLP